MGERERKEKKTRKKGRRGSRRSKRRKRRRRRRRRRGKTRRRRERRNQSINQHVIFSINRLINTVPTDNMEWTKARVPTSNFNKSVNLLQQRCMRYKRELFT